MIMNTKILFFEMHCCPFKNPNICFNNKFKNPCCIPMLAGNSMIPPMFNRKRAASSEINYNNIYYQYTYTKDSTGADVTRYQMFTELVANKIQIQSVLKNYENEYNSIVNTLNSNTGGGNYNATFTLLLFEYNSSTKRFVSLSAIWLRYILGYNDGRRETSDNKVNINIVTSNLFNLISSSNNKFYSLMIPFIEGTSNSWNVPAIYSNYEDFDITLNYYNGLNNKQIFIDDISVSPIETVNILSNFDTTNSIINANNYVTTIVKGVIVSPQEQYTGIKLGYTNGQLIFSVSKNGEESSIPSFDAFSKTSLINNNFQNLYYYILNDGTMENITTQPTQILFKQISFYKTSDTNKKYNYIINDNLDLSNTNYIKNVL